MEAALQSYLETRQEEARTHEPLPLAWERLHAQAPVASVFNSWIYQRTWLQCYGHGRLLRTVVARSAGGVSGLLALTVEEIRLLGLPVRIARLAGNGGDTHPDDLGPVVARDQELPASRALARALLSMEDLDVLELDDIDGRSPFPGVLAELARAAGLGCAVAPAQRIRYIDLPRSWGAYLASLSSDRRWRMRRSRRRLADALPTRFFLCRDHASLSGIVARLAAFHRARWGTESAAFSSRAYNALHLDVMEQGLARDWLRLYCLEVAGSLSAILYCYRFRNRVFLVQAGFDPACARWSPGAVLLGHALEHAIEEGNERFDFLRGEHAYKDELATGARQSVRVSVFRPTPAGLAYRACRAFAQRRRALRALARRLRGT